MNPKLLPILQRIIARDSVLRAFEANDLPQSALFYVRRNYLFADGFSDDEQDLLEELPPLADNLRESFRADSSADASRYYLFEDDSLLIVTNAYQQVWADARDFAIECILPLMRLDLMDADLLRAIGMDDAVESVRADSSADASRYYLFEDDSILIVTNAYQQVWSDARDFAIECILPLMRLDLMDAELLRAIGMDDAVESVRDDFFHAFAETLHKSCRIPHCDARGHWDAWSRQAPYSLIETAELGGRDSGSREGQLFAETFTPEIANA